jgi:hypothetical protein
MNHKVRCRPMRLLRHVVGDSRRFKQGSGVAAAHIENPRRDGKGASSMIFDVRMRHEHLEQSSSTRSASRVVEASRSGCPCIRRTLKTLDEVHFPSRRGLSIRILPPDVQIEHAQRGRSYRRSLLLHMLASGKCQPKISDEAGLPCRRVFSSTRILDEVDFGSRR